MKKYFFYLLICLSYMPFCTKDLNAPESGSNQLKVKTDAISDITATSVMAGGSIISDGGNAVTERGFVISKSSKPTIDDLKNVIGNGTGIFSDTIKGLSANSGYHLRSFATNSLGTVYGDVESFKTLFTTPIPSIPANGVQVRCCNINFQWSIISGASQYDLQISKNSAFTSSTYVISTCSSSTSLQNNSLNVAVPSVNNFCLRGGTSVNNGTWYWRVRAKTSSNTSNWSIVRTFNYLY